MPAAASDPVEPVETRKVTILARRTSASFQLAVIVTAAVIVAVLGVVLASLVVPGLWPDAGVLSFILLAGAIAVG